MDFSQVMLYEKFGKLQCKKSSIDVASTWWNEKEVLEWNFHRRKLSIGLLVEMQAQIECQGAKLVGESGQHFILVCLAHL